jgi:hypothetical protein
MKLPWSIVADAHDLRQRQRLGHRVRQRSQLHLQLAFTDEQRCRADIAQAIDRFDLQHLPCLDCRNLVPLDIDRPGRIGLELEPPCSSFLISPVSRSPFRNTTMSVLGAATAGSIQPSSRTLASARGESFFRSLPESHTRSGAHGQRYVIPSPPFTAARYVIGSRAAQGSGFG